MRKIEIIAALLLLVTAKADAQGVNPFGRYSSDLLTEADRDLAEQASARIYEAAAPSIGASEAWINPSTGNHGTVTLIGFREYQGLPCRTLRHRLEIKGYQRPIEFVLNRCRTEDGQWKLL